MDPQIFISYSSKDQKVAHTVCTALENRGLACWISSRNVKPGQNYQEQIVKAIRTAKIMVLVFTANANNSNEIKKELALASQNNLVVIPVRIEDVTPNEAFSYEFATRQWIDLFDNWEHSIGRVVEQIAGVVSDYPSGDRANAGAGLTGDAIALPFGKIVKAETAARGEPSDAIAAGEDHQKKIAKNPAWVMPVAIAAACLVVLVIAASVYLKAVRPSSPQVTSQPNPSPAAPTVTAAPKTQQAETLVPETIPFVSDHVRNSIRDEYMPAPDHKALAITTSPIGFITGQKDDETAKAAALDICQRRADTSKPPRKCELYAVGTTVVYAGGHPPMPPTPWYTLDQSVETPLVSKDIPLISDTYKANVEKSYLPGRKPKALVIGGSGSYGYYFDQETIDEAARRALESCGSSAGVACRVIAIDDNFVVSIPMTMKVVGFFQPTSANAIAPELRDDLARRLGNAAGGWSAVATGTAGRVGLMLKAANEQAAIDGALADCDKQDRSCHVIAIGQFAVVPSAAVVAPAVAPAAAAPPAQPATPPRPSAALPPAQPAAPASPATAPPGVQFGAMLHGMIMPGSIMRTVLIEQDDPANCQAACRADTACAAWTYNPSHTPGQPSHCMLKPVIPEQVANNCCTSGIERAPAPEFRAPPTVSAAVTGALSGVDLVGGDYRGMVGPQITPETCQSSCRADAQCLAWTYVRPGILGPDPRCAFKNRIAAQTRSNCCVSAIERQQTGQ